MVRRRGARKRISHTGRHLAVLPILFTGAGNRTSGPVLRSGSPRLVIQEAWAWLTATQLVRASAAAALRSEADPVHIQADNHAPGEHREPPGLTAGQWMMMGDYINRWGQQTPLEPEDGSHESPF